MHVWGLGVYLRCCGVADETSPSGDICEGRERLVVLVLKGPMDIRSAGGLAKEAPGKRDPGGGSAEMKQVACGIWAPWSSHVIRMGAACS